MENRFYEIPVEDLQQIDREWENRRRNADGTKAIIHVETLNELVSKQQEQVMTLSLEEDSELLELCYPVYSGEELETLLASPEWSDTIEENEKSMKMFK